MLAVCFACVLQILSPALPASVRSRLDAVMNQPSLSQTQSGALVVAVGSRPGYLADSFGLQPYAAPERQELYRRNADAALTPASTMKLLTVATALDRLGADYIFTTRVAVTGDPAAPDALYLVGGGDPSLDRYRLRQLAQQVAAAGVRRVAALRADTSRYEDRLGRGWTLDDTTWYYGAEATALTLDRNHVDVRITPAPSAGAPALITLDPPTTYLAVDNRMVTGPAGSGLRADFSRRPAQRLVVVSGRIPVGRAPFVQGVALPAPERYAAAEFALMLRQEGVAVELVESGTAPAGAATIASTESQPLGQLIQRLLKKSDNLYAELLLRELGWRAGRGSAAQGAAEVAAFLAAQGVHQRGVALRDGSGLSREVRLAPRTLVGVLRAMSGHAAAEPFFAALPIAGVDGTLRLRMAGTAGAANVRAKTGTLTGRTSLAGYVTRRDGTVLAAATMFNDFRCTTAQSRALHDAFFVALAE